MQDFGIEADEMVDATDIKDGPFYSIDAEKTIDAYNEVSGDFYVHEAVDASITNKYFDRDDQDTRMHIDGDELVYSAMPISQLRQSFKSLETQAKALVDTNLQITPLRHHTNEIIEPRVYLTEDPENDVRIKEIIDKFTLNTEQARAFRAVALHSLGYTKLGGQLLMGVFGEAGTGKSRVVTAIRAWFAMLNRSKELVTSAMTGSCGIPDRRVYFA